MVDTFKRPVSHGEGKVVQTLAGDTVMIFIFNFQCSAKEKKRSARFSFPLQRLLFKEVRKMAIKNCLTNTGKQPHKMVITRSTELCGFGLTAWSLNGWKIQVLLSASLKCICISQELQRENCSWLHKYFL